MRFPGESGLAVEHGRLQGRLQKSHKTVYNLTGATFYGALNGFLVSFPLIIYLIFTNTYSASHRIYRLIRLSCLPFVHLLKTKCIRTTAAHQRYVSHPLLPISKTNSTTHKHPVLAMSTRCTHLRASSQVPTPSNVT